MNQTIADMNKPNILLVDDEPRILRSLKAALKSSYNILTATDGHHAQKLLQESKEISVIISDEKMPQMPGHELLTWCKNNFPNVARILMTGYSDMKALQSSINDAEIYQYIAKPWNVSEIKKTIDHAVIQIKSNLYFNQHVTKTNDESCQLAIMNMVESNDDIYLNACQSVNQKPHITNCMGALTHLLEINKNIGVVFIDDDHTDEDTLSLVNKIHEKFPKIVIIVTTSAADGKNAIKLLNQGQIFKYLVKPITETKLVPMLNAAIAKHAEKDDRHDQILQSLLEDSFDVSLKNYWKKFASYWA